MASSVAWIDSLDWPLQQKLEEEPGELWSFEGQVAGWTRAAGNLRHTVIYRAGEGAGGGLEGVSGNAATPR